MTIRVQKSLLIIAIHLVYSITRLCFTGRSCLHCVQSWKSDADLATERLNVIEFFVHACGADINIQVTTATCLKISDSFVYVDVYVFGLYVCVCFSG